MEVQHNHNEPIKKVVIVGGGTAGWMAASSLAKIFAGMIQIELIESDEISTVGVGEATIPQIRSFNDVLGIDENDFIRYTQGTFKLGIQFNNWGRIGDSYMHAFSGIGTSLGMLDFYHYWLRAKKEGDTTSLWDYSLNTAASLDNTFAKVDKVGDTRLPGLNYAYHFDASLFARFLRKYCEQYSVIRTEGKIVDTRLREGDGFIESVVLENGSVIAGDLFIDCSGFRGLLIEGALNSGYEDWSHWLPCDRALAVPSTSVEPLVSYTRATAHSAGWQWRIPLQHRVGNGHVYCSRFMSEDEATSILLNNIDGDVLAEPRPLKFTAGRRKKFWNKNCIALGLASGFMEPLESTSIHLVQEGLAKLVEFFPTKSFSQADTDQYNTQMTAEYEHIRAFIILHYHATERTDSAFWNYCRKMEVPQALLTKMNLFKTHGRTYREANELFSEVAWLQIFIGQRIEPIGYHPLANILTSEQLQGFMHDIKTLVNKARVQIPSHSQYIAQYCAAPKM